PRPKCHTGNPLCSGLDDDPRRLASVRLATEQRIADLGGDATVDRSMGTIRVGRDHWTAGIRRLADRHVERNLTEEWHAETLRLVARAAVAENIGARAAMRAQEVAHVLDDAEHRHVD